MKPFYYVIKTIRGERRYCVVNRVGSSDKYISGPYQYESQALHKVFQLERREKLLVIGIRIALIVAVIGIIVALPV